MSASNRPARFVLFTWTAAILLAAAAFNVRAGEEAFNVRSKYVREYKIDKTTLVSTKVDHAPKLDGTLNDPLWSQAGKTESAFVLFPSKEPAGRQTMTYFCHDEKNLYITFDCEESELDQQQIDNKNIQVGDHVGAIFEVGDARGRGVKCRIYGNRSGFELQGAWRGNQIQYKCVYGPNRWVVQMGIPFAFFPGSEQTVLRGELWGLKLIRYGKTLETGASRLRESWPFVQASSEDVVINNGLLYFEADNMLLNGNLTVKDGALPGWTGAGGKLDANAEGGAAPEGITLTQTVKLRPKARFSMEWNSPAGWEGTAAVKTKAGDLASKPLADEGKRLDFQMPPADAEATVELKLKGKGPLPIFHLYFLLDDVPREWTCLTNNDWLPERNLKARTANAKEGRYTYLKPWLTGFGYTIYRSMGCPKPKEPSNQWKNPGYGNIGPPTQEPVDFPPKRTDIGEDEVENFPFEATWCDGTVPEMLGLPLGSFDKGGLKGWIPFSKGSLTGDESWAGWPVDRWAGAVAHDLLFDFQEKFYIRRIDVLFITPCFRNVDVYVRTEGKPEEDFVLIRKDCCPGTKEGFRWGALPPLITITGLDSVASQVRMYMGIDRPDGAGGAPFGNRFGRVNCSMDLFGIAEVWIWGEPKGNHADTEVNTFKPIIPNQQPPLVCQQLTRLPEPVIWPQPKKMQRFEGAFKVSADTAIQFPDSERFASFARQMQEEIARRFLVELPLKKDSEQVADTNAIWIGMKSQNPRFDKLCQQEGLEVPDAVQGYALKITPERILLAGNDAEGVFAGIQSLLQWADHDEKQAFFRAALIQDQPLIKLRTVVPTPDHRSPIYPGNTNERNYYRILNGLSRLRYNGLAHWFSGSVYQSEAKTLQLLKYASDRMVQMRPAVNLASVPGESLEVNPDFQPEGPGGIGTDDGYWETQNICPSHPSTYQAIEAYLDKALKFLPNARYVDFGYLGSHGGKWNVCRLCSKSGRSSAELYAEFVNRVAEICRKRGAIPVFSNAFMFGGGDKMPVPSDARGSALPLVSRDIMLRIDRPMPKALLEEAGFWALSRPWSTPGPSTGPGAYNGGKGFFAEAPSGGWQEGQIIAGDNCDYEWSWSQSLCGGLLLIADQFWNGPAPERTKESMAAYEAYALRASNACVRYNEQINLGHEYPSWRTGMTPEFFEVDLKPYCTRSHIDDGIASGLKRSGPKEGLLAAGPSFDFRRVPMGHQVFANVPFTVIDPVKNKWKSIVVIGTTNKEYAIPDSKQRVSILIGRKAASLCVLHCQMGAGIPLGHTHREQILPSFTYEYADGTRYVCDRELARYTVPLTCGLVRAFTPLGGNARGDNLLNFMEPTGRLAYATNTVAGAGASLFLNEFVNPYPDKEVKNLIVQLPSPELKDFTLTLHEGIFAVTGVAPTEWDVRFWKSRPPLPLLPPCDPIPESAKSLLSELEGTPQGLWVRKDNKQEEASVRGLDGAKLPTWELAFKTPKNLAAISYRLSWPGHYGGNMPIRYKHADVSIQVTRDRKEWKEAAIVRGATAMDGEQSVAVNVSDALAVRIVLDPGPYLNEEEGSYIGLLAIDAYVNK
ncbi:MAG: hypothetical protein HY291_09650 [Planctomycetes bacterium]|nr:hypothetical protein [Planctomycetota bacterium]